MDPLPIDPLLPEIVARIRAHGALVLEAPPGAGKTTRVPRALLDAGVAGEIVVLEPRRLAARLAARRVADELGERVGETVGYTVRFEDVSGPRTRVRFVTEGVLTRRLVADPELAGVGAVVLDEFHERHLQGDLALALLRRLRAQRTERLDLVVMSATLDAEPIAERLGCPAIRSEGRAYEVRLEHEEPGDDRALELRATSALRKALRETTQGNVLVFMPGAAEIRRTIEAFGKLAEEHDLDVVALHGDMTAGEQDKALARGRRRRVIVSTNVAESSVTLDGIVAVIDSGLVRTASHASWSGLPRVEIMRASRASCTQRAGRAGRTQPGVCLRLYTRADFEGRPAHDEPEIRRADLTQMLLELASMGASDVDWLDAPRPESVSASRELLVRLGAVDAAGALTPLGRRMLRLPLAPRLSRFVCEAERLGARAEACKVAAILQERDLRAASRVRMGGARREADVPTEASDVIALLDLFEEAESSGFSHGALRAAGLDARAVSSADKAARQIARALGGDRSGTETSTTPEVAIGQALLAAYPDRVARRKAQGSRELALAGGGAATLSEASAVRDAPFVVCVDAESRQGRAIVRVASAIEPEWLIDLFADRVEEADELSFDAAKGAVVAVSRMTYDGLTLVESAADARGDARAAKMLADAAWERGAHRLTKEGALDRWLARVQLVASRDPALRAVTDDDVRAAIVDMCEGKTSLRELEGEDLAHHLASRHPDEAAAVARLAPEQIKLASGRVARVEYHRERPPWMESFLQDFLGMRETPRVCGEPIVLHLLAPNRRAVQVTTDLAGFWERHYPAIRKELMRKYPRHAWPTDTSQPVPMRTRR
ncbi:MAG: ATP-dependent helicase HrpB [Myxococcales bacterium]|nr:ATP-dependent helicase HrpB [Myxococcales bacterium]